MRIGKPAKETTEEENKRLKKENAKLKDGLARIGKIAKEGENDN